MLPSEINDMYVKYGDLLIFMSFDNNDYIDCSAVLGGQKILFYKPDTLYDMCVCINSCKLFAGSLSSPFAIANALHKNIICGLCNRIGDNNHNLYLNNFYHP